MKDECLSPVTCHFTQRFGTGGARWVRVRTGGGAGGGGGGGGGGETTVPDEKDSCV